MMTSEALTMAVTSLPGASRSSLAASMVIDATRRTPPASSSTLAVASPRVTAVTRAPIWLRALSRINAPFRRHAGSATVRRDLGGSPAGHPLSAMYPLAGGGTPGHPRSLAALRYPRRRCRDLIAVASSGHDQLSCRGPGLRGRG